MLELNEVQFTELSDRGWTLLNQPETQEFAQLFLAEAQNLHAQGLFQPAQVGTGGEKKRLEAIRSDETYWIDDWTTSELRLKFARRMEDLRRQLNQGLMLAVRRYEAHFAHYAPGSFYRKHIDQLHQSSHRQITFLLYLSDWKPGDGGELALYHRDNPATLTQLIAPQQGNFLLFLSAHIPHEVLTTSHDRWSLSGWFRDDQVL